MQCWVEMHTNCHFKVCGFNKIFALLNMEDNARARKLIIFGLTQTQSTEHDREH